jgi:hypothetical protein
LTHNSLLNTWFTYSYKLHASGFGVSPIQCLLYSRDFKFWKKYMVSVFLGSLLSSFFDSLSPYAHRKYLIVFPYPKHAEPSYSYFFILLTPWKKILQYYIMIKWQWGTAAQRIKPRASRATWERTLAAKQPFHLHPSSLAASWKIWRGVGGPFLFHSRGVGVLHVCCYLSLYCAILKWLWWIIFFPIPRSSEAAISVGNLILYMCTEASYCEKNMLKPFTPLIL